MTTSYPLHKKMENKKQEIFRSSCCNLAHSTTTTNHQNTARHLILTHSALHTMFNILFSIHRFDQAFDDQPNKQDTHGPKDTQDIPCRPTPCRSNAQSHTKPSARLQTSFATTATTGMNFVRTRTLIEPSRRLPRRQERQKSKHNKKLPKLMAVLLPNRSSR